MKSFDSSFFKKMTSQKEVEVVAPIGGNGITVDQSSSNLSKIPKSYGNQNAVAMNDFEINNDKIELEYDTSAYVEV